MKEDQILRKYMEGELTPEELAQFKKRPEYAFLNDLHEKTGQWKTPDYDKAGVLRRVMEPNEQNITRPSEQGAKVFTLRPFIKYAVAASVALLVGLLLWPAQDQVFNTQAGETYAGVLPDNSSFILNSMSQMTYSEDDWKNSRTLHLQGEAFFDVEKGSTFRVETDLGAVSVLGTRFNVRSRDESFIVSCEEGRVKVVMHQSGDSTILEQGQATMMVESGTLRNFLSEETAPWRDGRSSFKNTPLNVVIQELEVQFDVAIVLDGIDPSRELSCTFGHDNLESALDIVLLPLSLKYQINPDGKIVVSKQ